MIISKRSWHYRLLRAIHDPYSDAPPKKPMRVPETSLGYHFKIATVLFWMIFVASACLLMGYICVSSLVAYGHVFFTEPSEWRDAFTATFLSCLFFGFSLAIFISFFGRALGVVITALFPWLSSSVTVID